MTKPLLIEIGVEEIPAIPFLKELPNIEQKWADILKENTLECEFSFFYTPRRLVLWHKNFKERQDDSDVEYFGAPVAIAYKDGIATNAAMSFAKKCGITVEELQTTTKDGKEILYFKQQVTGKNSKEVLNEMINKFVAGLNFGKSMRWADRSDSFIRPIRWLSVMLGNEIVPASLFGKKSSNQSFGHRMVSFEPFSFEAADEYFAKLSDMGIVLDPSKRREIVLDQIKNIEASNELMVELDEELLDEVVAITENPTALLGSFEEHFLTLPAEVIITSMKTNQRYFAVFQNGKLTNKFIVVANAICDDYSKIIEGNEKVLRPRLSDAMFFYQNDLKNGFNIDGLKNIIFMDGLGSVYDKVRREVLIADVLASKFDPNNQDDIKRAAYLAKGDLLTEVVYEFTELQGLMGSYYGEKFGENELVCLCIKEQYLPLGEASELPSTKASAIVAMSNKIDTLFGLFSLGKLPSGNKDPFALRRAAAGVIKIAIEWKLDFKFSDLGAFKHQYKEFDLKLLNDFICDRLEQICGVNPSIFKAVLASGDESILGLYNKAMIMNKIASSDGFKEMNSTFKRVANIIKDIDFSIDFTASFDKDMLVADEEKALYEAFNDIINQSLEDEAKLEALFGLKSNIDLFFEKVFVNDETYKYNRKALIAMIYLAFKEFADIKEISL